jgi:hypothetical protein
MSATTILQPRQLRRAMSVKRAAAFGLRDVGCVKWLASLNGAKVFTYGNA